MMTSKKPLRRWYNWPTANRQEYQELFGFLLALAPVEDCEVPRIQVGVPNEVPRIQVGVPNKVCRIQLGVLKGSKILFVDPVLGVVSRIKNFRMCTMS